MGVVTKAFESVSFDLYLNYSVPTFLAHFNNLYGNVDSRIKELSV